MKPAVEKVLSSLQSLWHKLFYLGSDCVRHLLSTWAAYTLKTDHGFPFFKNFNTNWFKWKTTEFQSCEFSHSFWNTWIWITNSQIHKGL